MGQGSAVTDALRTLIGKSSDPVVLEVEKGAIRRFCEAVGDSNPLFTDTERARNGPHGEVICPPGFFGWPAKTMPRHYGVMASVFQELARAGFPGVLDGGVEYELLLPIRGGDTLILSTKVEDIYERTGKTGASLFAVVENTYLNQNGDVVARARNTYIGRPA